MRVSRAFGAGVVVAIGCVSAALAQTQNGAEFFRGKTVNLYIGAGAGGGYDLSSRVLARHMGRHLPGEPAIVPRNMPGAGGLQLAAYLYNAAPKDGLEFGLLPRTVPLEPLMGSHGAGFDAQKFTWLGSTSNEVSTCVAWHDAAVKTAEDLLSKELTVAAAGPASPSAVFPYLFKAALGMKFKVINGYPGSANELAAMEQGEVGGFCGWGWMPMQATHPQWIAERKFNVLFQIGLSKHPQHMEAPLILDYARNPDDRRLMEIVIAPQTFARPFAAPPGLPPERAAILRAAFEATLRDPAYVEEAERLALEPELVDAAKLQDILGRIYAAPPALIARAKVAMSAVNP
jgi:tripartite-type tricarboxylate transporter receptor subunit TctC